MIATNVCVEKKTTYIRILLLFVCFFHSQSKSYVNDDAFVIEVIVAAAVVISNFLCYFLLGLIHLNFDILFALNFF